MGFLLDTDVLSELRRRRPEPAVLRWLDGVDGTRLHLSVLVLGELEQGIERLRPRDAGAADALAAWLADIRHRFADRIIPVDDAVHDLTLVTRNARDVRGAGVRVLDPFAAA